MNASVPEQTGSPSQEFITMPPAGQNNSLRAGEVTDLASHAENPYFVPTPEQFIELRTAVGELALHYDDVGELFRDSSNKPVDEATAETLFELSQPKTWRLDDATRQKYREALSISTAEDMVLQPEAIRSLYKKIWLAGTTLGRTASEAMADFRGVIQKSLALDKHLREDEKNKRDERRWNQKGANVAHNRLIRANSDLFHHIAEDSTGNLVCYNLVTDEDGSTRLREIPTGDAEKLAKYRVEFAELRRLEQEAAADDEIERAYKEDVLQVKNFITWVKYGNYAHDFECLPYETRTADMRSADLDKELTYTNPNGVVITTRFRKPIPINRKSLSPQDIVNAAREIVEITIVPSVARGLLSIVNMQNQRIHKAGRQKAFLQNNEHLQKTKAAAAAVRNIYDKKQHGTYSIAALEEAFDELKEIDLDEWIKQKMIWHARYESARRVLIPRREAARQILREQIEGKNPFEHIAKSPYVSYPTAYDKLLIGFSDGYNAYIRSRFFIDGAPDDKLYGTKKSDYLKKLSPKQRFHTYSS